MRIARYVAAGLLLLLIIAAATIWFTLRASLPQLSGNIAISRGLVAAASIERDADGTPTIKAKSRADLAFATGFAHAQDRFFQMDLMRRAASGELAELLGHSVIETDQRLRLHDFHRVAAEVVAAVEPAEKALLDAYVAGVNAGLASLGSRPWEYQLLRSQPRAWTAEDSLLAAFSMYLSLNDSTGSVERTRAALHETLPAEMFAFLHPYGTSWDAPLTGGTWQAPPIPSADVFDLRKQTPTQASVRAHSEEAEEFVGSNSWAVDGAHAAGGGALLANDMHLGLRLPHVWYRARMIVDTQDDARRDLVGVTLPGLPMLLVGSNGHVAWGYTNSYGDWTDVIVAEADPSKKDRYFHADGSEQYRVRREIIKVRGEAPLEFNIWMTRWGPVIERDANGNSLVLAWTAHRAKASNLHLLDLERATTVDEALDAANRSGGPVQNIVVADSTGKIGWSLMGQVPVRANYDSALASSWRKPNTGWIGWRTPAEYPRIVAPASGRLWTANDRTLDARTWLDFLGDGGYDLGARAAQVRDDLLALDQATVADMAKIQLDDRALFLVRWRDLLIALLTKERVGSDARRAEALRLVTNWSQRAAVDDAGYRIVRAFRMTVRDDVYDALTGAVQAKYPDLKFTPPAQFEGPLWQLVTERPAHLLSPRFTNWDDALLHSLDTTLTGLVKECGDLPSCTWGRVNTLSMKHPLSDAVPGLHRWVDMPAVALPGDAFMPRVQGPGLGASERLVVSPGRESEGILQVPGGPVDHPLSPFYGAGHEAWAKGTPQPLLPGKTQYMLGLNPQH
jgi:penicillin amidase